MTLLTWFSLHVGRYTLAAAESGAVTWLQWLRQTLRQRCGPPLKAVHAPIDQWLGGLPMWLAELSAIGLYVLALVWVWVLRSDFVFRGAPDRRPWRDLRIWATAVVIPYIVVYALWGR